MVMYLEYLTQKFHVCFLKVLDGGLEVDQGVSVVVLQGSWCGGVLLVLYGSKWFCISLVGPGADSRPNMAKYKLYAVCFFQPTSKTLKPLLV